MHARNVKGVTLVELMVAIGVVAILAGNRSVHSRHGADIEFSQPRRNRRIDDDDYAF